MITLDELEKEVIAIYDFLSSTIPDDLSVLPAVGSDIACYLARSGKMLADAKYLLNVAIMNAIKANKQDKMTTSVYNLYIKSLCTRENYLVDLCERCNSSAVHQLDWVRTLISKGKEEMKLSNMIGK